MRTIADNVAVYNAMFILENRLRREGVTVTSPDIVKDFLKLSLAEERREVFGVIFLDSSLRMIEYEALFYGTLAEASVYPREVVKRALELNAASVIFAHNHPSGIAEPSRADIGLTENLRRILNIIDVRVLDHIIVGDMETMSFAECGYL